MNNVRSTSQSPPPQNISSVPDLSAKVGSNTRGLRPSENRASNFGPGMSSHVVLTTEERQIAEAEANQFRARPVDTRIFTEQRKSKTNVTAATIVGGPSLEAQERTAKKHKRRMKTLHEHQDVASVVDQPRIGHR